MHTGLRLTAAGIAAASALAGLAAAPAPASEKAADTKGPRPVFSLSAVNSGRLTDVSGVAVGSPEYRALETHGFSVLRAASGETAVVDRSSAREGITAAAGKSFVELSWKGYAPDARYVVTRDDKEVAHLGAGVVSFRDTNMQPGSVHHYQVAPVLPEGGHPQARLYGLKVSVPASGSLAGLRRQAISRAIAAGVASSSILTWTAFIPQKKVNAPLAGCDYGRNFQFGGDGHSNFDWNTAKYRTRLDAFIKWRNKSVMHYKFVNATKVYVKSTGRHVATKTASDRDMQVKKLGSGRNYVDVRMVLHASNPFCRGLGSVKGAIDGAFTMNLTTSGNYTIRSGKHRLMPNHHIYVYDGGRVTNVYTRKYANVACLIGSSLCPEADLTGYRGSF